jgi:uncharacterized protein YdaU (DUF1376 family)
MRAEEPRGCGYYCGHVLPARAASNFSLVGGLNYYEHHIGDYLKDTISLSMLEEGAYRRLIDAYYAQENPLPADVRECFRIARATTKAEKDAVKLVLGRFFVRTEDGFRQGRADKEIERFRSKSSKASASASARWSKCDGNANASPNASPNASRTHMPTRCESDAPNPQSPVTSNQSDGSLRSPSDARAPEFAALSPSFEPFLAETYPPSPFGNDHITALHSAMGIVGQRLATEAQLRARLTGFRAFVDTGGYSPDRVPKSENWFAINRQNPYWAREWKAVPTKAEQAVDSTINAGLAFLRAGAVA